MENGFDLHIPSSLWDSGSYNWFNLEIKLSKTNRADFERDKENCSGFPVLVHEYTHYLQNFTTLFGLTTFMTYVDCFSFFFAKNVELTDDPQLPLKGGIVDKAFGDKNLHNFFSSVYLGINRDSSNRIVFEKSSDTAIDFSFIKKTVINDYHQKKVEMYHIAFKGQLIPLNELILRENMAMVATVIAAKLSLSESDKLLKEFKYGLEYTILYKYLSTIFPKKNCIELTYQICEISLLIAPFCATIHKILIYVQADKMILSSLSEEQIIRNIKYKLNFKANFDAQIRKGIEMIDQRIRTSEKHIKNYEFFIYTIDFWNILKQGLIERQKRNSFYESNFGMPFLTYYSSVVKSPVIIFGNNEKSIIGQIDTDYINSIANLSGILTALHRLYYHRKIQDCPFIGLHSYCNHKKGEECKTNFLNIHKRWKYAGCLMHNSLNVIGVRSMSRKLSLFDRIKLFFINLKDFILKPII